MTTKTTQDDLHQRIAALLNRSTTGNAVAQELNGRYAAMQARSDRHKMPARLAQRAIDATAEAMFPSHSET